MAQPSVLHTAPAGGTYRSIQEAGKTTLERYCDKYPNTTSSFILPNMFPSSFPDVIDSPPAGLTVQQKRQFDGLQANMSGERAEYDIYLQFTSIARKTHAEPILVLWGTKFDSDNSKALKVRALMHELPSITLVPGDMSQEKDFIVFVGNCGAIFGEVKRSGSPGNIYKAEKQLESAERLIQKVMCAISGPGRPALPVVKLILIPGESVPNPATKTSSGCHRVHKDFQVKWKEAVNELKAANGTNPINPADFKKLVEIYTGLWTMMPLNNLSVTFKQDEISLASNVERINDNIKRAGLYSQQGAQFSRNTAASLVTNVSCRDKELNVRYFSPQQKLLFENYRHAIIRSPAGCGKTLLILIKILDILEKDPTQKILLIAPKPHHVRCMITLERCNVTTQIFQQSFPLPPETPFPISSDVTIIELKQFFNVPRETLLSYDISMFNVFADDTHRYLSLDHSEDDDDDSSSNFTDIGDFIDQTYRIFSLNMRDKYCWFGFDEGQQITFDRNQQNNATGLFLTENGGERLFDIPVFIMDQVLRNSKEIVGVLEGAREQQARYYGSDISMMLPNNRCGHHITSQKVIFHTLKERGESWGRDLYARMVSGFVNACVKDVIRSLSSTSHHSFDFSSVAILFDNKYELARYKSTLTNMLLTTFNLRTQTINKQILHNDPTHVVMDICENIQSFEASVVVYVRWDIVGAMYNAVSRARTLCVVIDVDIGTPSILQNADIVQWQAEEGREADNISFYKVT